MQELAHLVERSGSTAALTTTAAATLSSEDQQQQRQRRQQLPVQLPTDYQQFIHKSRYARWLPDKRRRESWPETVCRYFDFMERHLEQATGGGYRLDSQLRRRLEREVLDLRVMPSMRALMTAGEALERCNVAGYNCSYLPIDSMEAFDELLYILLTGCGVGYSVEERYVARLPTIPASLASPSSSSFSSSPSSSSSSTTTTSSPAPPSLPSASSSSPPSLSAAPSLQQQRQQQEEEKEGLGQQQDGVGGLLQRVVFVQDSKEGWAAALRELIAHLYSGHVPSWDLSLLRPEGARLKTFGGRASGPGPLQRLFEDVVAVFRGAAGRKLTPLEAHDLVCNVAELVVVGGVRRSALICLSDLGDQQMRSVKAGAWWEDAPQRALANVSAVYSRRPPREKFDAEWDALRASGSGERGIFSRYACERKVSSLGGRRQVAEGQYGTNPCSEIILRPYQFCNLTEVVVREGDDEAELAAKVEAAAVLGTFQASLTQLPYLRPVWERTTKEEALLGVSLTGIMDNRLAAGLEGEGRLEGLLQRLREVAIQTNARLAPLLGIESSAAVTCVKPSGTVSQLVNSASGIHPRFSRYYVRTVRGDAKDPLTQFLKDAGVPWEACVMRPGSTVVFSFPVACPPGAVTRDEVSALDQLRLWVVYNKHYCDHKPSITVYVREHEWDEVGDFVYEHLDDISGVAFLPFDNGTYQQAPYQVIDEETYDRLVAAMPASIPWESFAESEDDTTVDGELVCTAGGGCEMVDLIGGGGADGGDGGRCQ